MSFLTKTLPKLGRALDQGLASLEFQLPSEFKCSHGKPNIPAFMQGYFNSVFDAYGTLRDEASPPLVSHLRQVLFFAYKLKLSYTDSQVSSTLDSFVETDASLSLPNDRDSQEILDFSSQIISGIFEDFNPKDILPRHGPGAVATGERGDSKWIFSRRYDAIHQMYPYYDYFIVGGGRELMDRLDWYKKLERLDQGRAKVVLVPKDSRGPRLISCEPLEYQWVQQGLGRKLVSHLESCPMTKDRINFANQEINRQLALVSSSDRAFSTIDLKDASDRVSMELVRRVFSKTPDLLRALEACRTGSTLLPDGRVVEFQKFAPMGSALCFPVEATIFWVLLVAAVSRHLKIRWRDVGRSIFVYGDDIIIPTPIVDRCIQVLERFSLKVNRTKCCVQGPFRESCGMDAFKGVSVTPIRLRTVWTGRKTDGAAYVSYVETANALFAASYTKCSEYLWEQLEKTYGKVPYGTSHSAFPCRLVSDPEEAERLNALSFRRRNSRRYHRIEFLVPRLIPKRKKTNLGSWSRMLRNLLMPPYGDPSSIVEPRSMIINRGWTPVF
jgi:hypothetical protein